MVFRRINKNGSMHASVHSRYLWVALVLAVGFAFVFYLFPGSDGVTGAAVNGVVEDLSLVQNLKQKHSNVYNFLIEEGVDVTSLALSYEKTGSFTESQYYELETLGFSRSLVNQYLGVLN